MATAKKMMPCECGCGVMLGQNPNGYSARRFWSDACQRRAAKARDAEREEQRQVDNFKRRLRYSEKRRANAARARPSGPPPSGAGTPGPSGTERSH